MSKHTEEHPDLPPLLADIEGDKDAEFVWDMWRTLQKHNMRLAAENQVLRDRNFLLVRRYKRLRAVFLKFRQDHKL